MRRTERLFAIIQTLRAAMRENRKLALRYVDADGAPGERVVWPVLLAFVDDMRVLIAWRELREDFRRFRADRIEALEASPEPFPEPRAALVRKCRASVRKAGP